MSCNSRAVPLLLLCSTDTLNRLIAAVCRLRMQCKPLNGETAFVDTAAAFADLPKEERDYLETLQVIRRMDDRDSGFTAPLVKTNPLSGLKSLHSPWNCRRGGVPELEIPVSRVALLEALVKAALVSDIRRHRLI